MQTIARDGLTADEVREVVTDSAVTIDVGLEYLDDSNVFQADISDWLVPSDSEVSRQNYATVHGACKLTLSKELDWGKDRVQPYMRLTSPVGTFRVDLGVYVLSTPDTTAGEDPKTWTVEGYDLLEVLNHPHGSTFVADAGDVYLDEVETLVTGKGLEASLSDKASGKTLPREQVWPIDGRTTTLNVVNDLLGSAGYRSANARWDGVIRSQPYTSPSDRAVEWTYDAQADATIVAPRRTLTADFFDAPNKWVFIIDDPDFGEPTEGDGIYTVTNQSDGDTSVDARGRTITRVERLDAADQESLETRGDRIVEQDKKVTEEFTRLSVGANPLHWHMDVVRVVDSALGFDEKCVVRSWKLPLDGSDMTLDVRAT